MVDGGSHHEDNEGTLVLIEELRAHRDRQGCSQPPTPRPEPETTPAPEVEPGEDPAHLALGIAGGCQPNADEAHTQHESPAETPPAAGGDAWEEAQPPPRSPDETLDLDTSEASKPTAPIHAQQTSSLEREEEHATHRGVAHALAATGSAVMGTAHLPKDTPTSRPKRQRTCRAERQRHEVHTEPRESRALRSRSPTIALSGNGPQALNVSAASAAGNNSSPTETINVDSVQPTIALTGPSTASSDAGTQYVTATATVGDSGLGAISCSVDGGPQQSYSNSPAQVPVSGLGSHSVECMASNRSFSSAGQVAVSTPATFSMDIAEPTVSGISFTNILHSLKCHKVKERVKVPAKWVTVRGHGKVVKVHRRARTKLEKVMKCKMRVVKRKVTVMVKIKRHGKTVLVKRKKIERIPVPPQAVVQSTKSVAFGKGTTVTGFLDTAGGIAPPGRAVDVLTAPDNQLGQWSQAAAVRTEANGGWTATLPPGPSRLVEGVYAGDSTTLPAASPTATLLVPAHIGITVTPRRLPWSGAVTIRGHLSGGYVPPDGVPLYLEIDTARHHRPYTPVPLRTNAKGTFAFQFSWKSGRGVATYPVRIALLGTGSDYPFVASSSHALKVTFGRATPHVMQPFDHKKHKRHKRRRR
jgi:hypothetical protein